MQKSIILCLCCFILFVLPTFAQKKNTKKSVAVKKTKKVVKVEKSFVCQLPPSVMSVDVSRKEIVFCPSSNDSCSKDSIIEIKTVAMDNGEINYIYTVSGGKIIGEGANVKWDLSGVAPGTYTITAAVDDGNGKVYGQTKTETVKVIE